MPLSPTEGTPVATLTDAELVLGDRVLWRGLTLSIARGEFVAVLGPNGSGQDLVAADAAGPGAADRRFGRGHHERGLRPAAACRRCRSAGRARRDLVGFSVDGSRWGIGWRDRRRRRELVDAAVAQVDASGFASRPFGLLSGGEQQRLRVAQALTRDPGLLLCDEPLSSLDPGSPGSHIGTAGRDGGRRAPPWYS